MLTSVYILSRTGSVIASKHCRDILPASLPTLILDRIRLNPDVHCLEVDDKTVIWTTDSSETVYYIGVATEEVQPLLVTAFLRRLDHNLRVTLTTNREIKLPGKEETPFGDVLLRSKRSVLVQILEEVMDGGFITNMESNCIAALIPQLRPSGTISLSAQGDVARALATSATDDLLPEEATSAVPWRRPDVVHSTNGIYFDIIESVNAMFTPAGTPALLSVNGRIRTSCLISGTPDVEVRVNDPALLADATVHPCVRYRRLEKRGVLSFVPPDGEFDLISYSCNHLTASTAVPVKVKPTYNLSAAGVGSLTLEISVIGQAEVNDVVLDVIMPRGVDVRNIKQTSGSAKCFTSFDTEASLYKVSVGTPIAPASRGQLTRTNFDDPGVPDAAEKSFKPGDKIVIRCDVLDRTPGPATPFRPTVSLSYSFTGSSASGLRVKGVDIKQEGETTSKPPFKGIKTTTVSNDVIFLC